MSAKRKSPATTSYPNWIGRVNKARREVPNRGAANFELTVCLGFLVKEGHRASHMLGGVKDRV